MSHDSLFPRGDPLTEVMELSTPDGVRWVAYIDRIPAPPPRRLMARTVLPGRRLRFDSATESRASRDVPAGSPFLAERRLLDLVAASPILPLADPVPLVFDLAPKRPAVAWRRHYDAAMARGRALWSRGGRLAAHVADTVRAVMEVLLHGFRAAGRSAAFLLTRGLQSAMDQVSTWAGPDPMFSGAALSRVGRLAVSGHGAARRVAAPRDRRSVPRASLPRRTGTEPGAQGLRPTRPAATHVLEVKQRADRSPVAAPE